MDTWRGIYSSFLYHNTWRSVWVIKYYACPDVISHSTCTSMTWALLINWCVSADSGQGRISRHNAFVILTSSANLSVRLLCHLSHRVLKSIFYVTMVTGYYFLHNLWWKDDCYDNESDNVGSCDDDVRYTHLVLITLINVAINRYFLLKIALPWFLVSSPWNFDE